MNNEEIKDESFHLPLIISTFLVVDIIILFFLCLIELSGVSHLLILGISFLVEFLAILLVVWKGNIRSSVILYILFLVSPVFLNLIAMGMHYITDAMPFTPTILVLFRSGYDLKGNLMGVIMRSVITFRLPALMGLVASSIIYLIKKTKQRIAN